MEISIIFWIPKNLLNISKLIRQKVRDSEFP